MLPAGRPGPPRIETAVIMIPQAVALQGVGDSGS
jgi:hypothetical protein